MGCFPLRWHRHVLPPYRSHCLLTVRDDAMASTPLSRRSEEGFNRRQKWIQIEWFPEDDELALLELLWRELAIGRDQDRGERCYLFEALIEFDAVHVRQPIVQDEEARSEVPHQFQGGLAITSHDRS